MRNLVPYNITGSLGCQDCKVCSSTLLECASSPNQKGHSRSTKATNRPVG